MGCTPITTCAVAAGHCRSWMHPKSRNFLRSKRRTDKRKQDVPTSMSIFVCIRLHKPGGLSFRLAYGHWLLNHGPYQNPYIGCMSFGLSRHTDRCTHHLEIANRSHAPRGIITAAAAMAPYGAAVHAACAKGDILKLCCSRPGKLRRAQTRSPSIPATVESTYKNGP